LVDEHSLDYFTFFFLYYSSWPWFVHAQKPIDRERFH